MQLKNLYLKPREEKRIAAGHLWIFSNEIDTKKSPLAQFKPGELVSVQTQHNKNLGIAYINPHTLLCARLLTRINQAIDTAFFIQLIQQALALRAVCFNAPFYRLIFGEADFLPGLIVDRFDDVLVVQITTAGMENLKSVVIEALIAVLNPKHILLRNDTSSRELEGLPLAVEAVYGAPPQEITIEENNTKFYLPLIGGQKTGWFYDQKLNRSRLKNYIANKNVLDVFSYVGSWGITAAKHSAKSVTCIDSSALAADYIKRNAEFNDLANIHVINEDAFTALKNLRTQHQKFEVIILDPPAFIKKRKDLINGTLAYLRLHEMALQLLQKNGFLFTCSCSMHLAKENFLDIIRKAGIAASTKLKIIEHLHQAQDHPIHPAINETEYLKGFIVWNN